MTHGTWIPKHFSPDQAAVLLRVAAIDSELANAMLQAFPPPDAPAGKARGIKPNVPVEVIDAWLARQPFEWVATFKQLPAERMSMLDQAFNDSTLPAAMAFEWDAGNELDGYTRAESRRALKRNTIGRFVLAHGEAIRMLGMNEIQTLEKMLTS